MGELKPLGSEKLSGDAKLKRILELTYYQSPVSTTKSTEVVKESKSGVYGIVKEKDGYYVKKGLTENSLDYIGGMFMKNKNRFHSYNEAFKKLEFLTEQELLTEATKYVLKQNKPTPAPQAEAPIPAPTTDMAPPPPAPAPGGDVPPPAPGGEDDMGDMGGEDDMGDETAPEDPNQFMKIIQKRTGKLSEKLNAYKDKLESKDIKYVVNMVLAAVDLDKLEDSDEEEILAKFDEDDEGGASPASDFPTDDSGEVPAPQDEMSEVDGIGALDELINTPFDDDDDDDYSPEELDFLDTVGNEKAGNAAHRDIKKDLGIKTSDNDDDDIDFNTPIGTDDDDEKGFSDLPMDDDDDDDADFNQELSRGSFDEMDEEDEFGDELSSDKWDPSSEKDVPLYTGDEEMTEEDPMSDTGQMPSMAADETREIDIDELTNMVNTSVKETLSKYFR